MANTSDSNNILKTILIIIVVVAIAYIIYYLYTQNSSSRQYKVEKYTDDRKDDIEDDIEERFYGGDASIDDTGSDDSSVDSQDPNSSEGFKSKKQKQKQKLAKGQHSAGYCGYLKKEYKKQNCAAGKSGVLEGFESQVPPNMQEMNSLPQFPKDQLTADELLPKDNSSLWAQVNPSGEGSLKDRNFLQSGYHIGINTVGQTLRNANLQLRSEPPCPQVRVSPWIQSTIEPDLGRKPFEIGGCA